MSATLEIGDDLPDVETTNWNAVKLLATKYGIQMRTLEEVHASFLRNGRQSYEQNVRTEEHDKGKAQKDFLNEEDLGAGTPFIITARMVDGGRVIYRFKHRYGEGSMRGDSSECVEGMSSLDGGYDAGPDSPSSSWGKSAGKKKASSRTLKSKRSVPLLSSLAPSGNTSLKNDKGGNPLKNKRSFSAADAKSTRTISAPIIQRGDVLGAILGLRAGINNKNQSWDPAILNGTAKGKGKDGKVKLAEQQADDRIRFAAATQNRHTEVIGRSLSPFGEPVLQKSRDVSFASQSMFSWQKSPIPRLTEFGQPLFSDPEEAFNAPLSPQMGMVDDIDEEILVFDLFQRDNDPVEQPKMESNSSSMSRSRSRQASSSSSNTPASPTFVDDNNVLANASTLVDDPRFALWAVRSRADGDALVLSSREGIIPSSPMTSPVCTPGSNRRFSLRASTGPLNDHSSPSTSIEASKDGKVSSSSTTSENAFMIAASSTYLVAEITSRIDNRLMTDFFYTYRSYMSSHDLLQLLILRFKWAMTRSRGSKDEARRKIVRVRTYVVIKYWLTNFFEVDFIPNRVLRKELTDWLNALSDKEALPDVSIIKSLKKIVRGLKQNYEQAGVGGILFSDTGHSPESANKECFSPASQDTRKGEPNVNLDFENQSKSPSEGSSHPSPIYSELTWRNSSNDEYTSTPMTNSISSSGNYIAPPPLPTSHQNAISKAFVNTVGRFSRFKRNMNTRAISTGNSSSTGGSDGGDHEISSVECGDLLFIQGGVESFLAFFNLHSDEVQSQSMNRNESKGRLEEAQTRPSEEEEVEIVSDEMTAQEANTPSLSAASHHTESTPASSIDLDINDAAVGCGLGIVQGSLNEDVDLDEMAHLTHANLAMAPKADLLHHFQSDQTLRSMSTAQPTPIEEECQRPKVLDFAYDSDQSRSASPVPPGGPNIVQIDDIDLSSDEDDGMVRRALRRLPGARDLRIANNVRDLVAAPHIGRLSVDSISASSFGQVHGNVSRQSLASHFRIEGEARRGSYEEDEAVGAQNMLLNAAPFKIGTVQTEMFDPDEALQGYELVKGFRLDQLELQSDDEEEVGDVEAALRRLEGFIDKDKQREKVRRVEAMWQRSQNQGQEEIAKKELNEDESAFKLDEQNKESAPVIQLTAPEERISMIDHEEFDVRNVQAASPASGIEEVMHAKPTSHQLQRRKGSNQGEKMKRGASVTGPQLIPMHIWNLAPTHRSFLLDYRSEVIAQQFCLIESELFTSVTWQELVSDQWKKRDHAGQVLDWTSFYKARVKRRAEIQINDGSISQETNVEAIVARFNLTCNWVASEIVLTRSVDDRAAVICKFIRIAWKCYHFCNFSTLAQIILGLQSPWVERLTRTWTRIGMLEMRMLRDLKAFINPAKNFKHLRIAMRDMVIKGGMEDLITSSGPPRIGSKGKQTSQQQVQFRDGCIPFFGLFLSDLAVNDSLPTLIEPSSPGRPIDVDPKSGKLNNLADSRAFDHLPILPKSIQLSPLINLYKYRMIASTIKSVLALQERLASFEYKADAEVYVKTLRLRCLEGEQLTQISHLVEP